MLPQINRNKNDLSHPQARQIVCAKIHCVAMVTAHTDRFQPMLGTSQSLFSSSIQELTETARTSTHSFLPSPKSECHLPRAVPTITAVSRTSASPVINRGAQVCTLTLLLLLPLEAATCGAATHAGMSSGQNRRGATKVAVATHCCRPTDIYKAGAGKVPCVR